jgi:hypothetical protein
MDPIGERVAMKRGMLPNIGPAAGSIAGHVAAARSVATSCHEL